jgi:hypothetical protein
MIYYSQLAARENNKQLGDYIPHPGNFMSEKETKRLIKEKNKSAHLKAFMGMDYADQPV